MARPVVTIASHATRASGSLARIASRMASEIWSASLSGWPSVTDSDVNSDDMRSSLESPTPARTRDRLRASPSARVIRLGTPGILTRHDRRASIYSGRKGKGHARCHPYRRRWDRCPARILGAAEGAWIRTRLRRPLLPLRDRRVLRRLELRQQPDRPQLAGRLAGPVGPRRLVFDHRVVVARHARAAFRRRALADRAPAG